MEFGPEKDIAESVRSCLRGFGYPVAEHIAGIDFRFALVLPSRRSYRAQLVLAPPTRVVRFFAFLTDDFYPDGQRPWVTELVLRLDEKIGVLGGFGMQWDHGGIFYRAAVDFSGTTSVADGIERMLNATSFPLRVWEYAYGFLGTQGVSPGCAVDAALIAHECGEFAMAPREALKLVLKVERGEGQSAPSDLASPDPKPGLSLL